MENSKPYVTCALVCERVLEEKDGVLSVIRIIDSVWVDLTELEGKDGPIPRALPFSMLIALKAGALRGDYSLTIHIRNPVGKTTPIEHRWAVHFTDAAPMANFIVNVRMVPSGSYGDYWFDVMWEDSEQLISIPLTLRPVPDAPGANPAQSPKGGPENQGPE